MRSFLLFPLLFLAAPSLWGQVDGVTTSVSRTITLFADEARFTVDVEAPFPTSLNQVLEKLSGAGIQAGDLTGEELSPGYTIEDPKKPAEVEPVFSLFTFNFTRQPADTKALIDQLDAIRRSLPSGFSVQYGIKWAASAHSAEALKSTVQPQLVIEARRKAQTIADAAGLRLGSLESVSTVRQLRSYAYAFLDANIGGIAIFDPYPSTGPVGSPVVLAPVISYRSYLITRERPGVEEADTVDGFLATYTVTARFAVQ